MPTQHRSRGLHVNSSGRIRLSAAALAVALAAASITAVVTTGTANAVVRPALGQNIKVNQVAYAPGAAKQATVISNSGSPLAWNLLDGSDQVVASGTTTVFGADSLSGDSVHK